MTMRRVALAVAGAAVVVALAIAVHTLGRGHTSPPVAPAPDTTTAPPSTTIPVELGPGGGTPVPDAESIVVAFATGLYTVDYTRPLPTAQRLAACRRFATERAAAKLAHGQYFQPGADDPHVAAGEVDTVDRVDVTAEDPTATAGIGYSVVVTYTARTRTGTQSATAYLEVRVIAVASGWLVDDAQAA